MSKITRLFAPLPTKDVERTYKSLRANFPFAQFCVYQGGIIAPLQHHLASNQIIYVETARDVAETVFNFLRGKGHRAYLRPDEKMIYHYVDMDKKAFFVKNLVSEAPLQQTSNIPMPTLEKLLVDILRDKDFFYLQGSESEHIIENAYSLYAIKKGRLLRYADRRKVKKELLAILKNLNIDDTEGMFYGRVD